MQHILIAEETDEVFMEFLEGNCNVMAIAAPEVPALLVRAMGYVGEVAIGQNSFSSDMLSLVSLHRDPEFADALNAILMALFWAENHNITKATADQMVQTNLFGEENKDMFRNAVEAGKTETEGTTSSLEVLSFRPQVNPHHALAFVYLPYRRW